MERTRHPAADLKPCGAERVRDGDGHIAAGKIQRAREDCATACAVTSASQAQMCSP